MPTVVKKKNLRVVRGRPFELISPGNKIKLKILIIITDDVYVFKDHIHVGNITYKFNLIYKSFRREMCKSE